MNGSYSVPSPDSRSRARRVWTVAGISRRVVLFCGVLAAAPALEATTLDSVSPERQLVYEMITLRGQDFGAFVPGLSKVVFETPDQSIRIEAGRPYVWRDDFIQVRVPAGGGGHKTPKTELRVSVEAAGGASASLPFQLLVRVNEDDLSFVERTHIVNHADVSGFLGDVDSNKARTKNGDFADVNGDGWVDLIDNNSNNVSNGTHSVLRRSNGGVNFNSRNWEPLSVSDNEGPFVVTVPPGGKFVGNAIVYDADFVDLNNDELPDWVETDAGGFLGLRVAMNNDQGVPGRFIEATNTWLPNQQAPGSPDDLRHEDINFDGFVDVLTSYRFSPNMDVFLNQNGQKFGQSVRITAPSGSIHDVVFIDANADGFADVIGANESGTAWLFLNNGHLPVPGFTFDQSFPDDAHSGIAADFNGDGFEDFGLSQFMSAAVYLNNPNDPDHFTRVALPDPQDFVYDLEPADVDMDGDIDLIGAAVILDDDGGDAARVWINANGDGTVWTTWSDANDILPGIGPYQRLSASLVDFDRDGDLDLYLTGSDGEGPWGFGASPNQFWENKLVGLQVGISGTCPGPATVSISAATPNSGVAVFGSKTLGSTTLSTGPCSGTRVDLVNPKLLRVAAVDASGNLTANINTPANACDFFVQVVEQEECSVSNVVPVP